MRRRALLLSWLCLALLASPPARAEETSARQAILMDLSTGTVLMEKNADEQVPTSSMSKVITIYQLFDALKSGRVSLEDTFIISSRASKMGGSKMFLEPGWSVKVEELIQGVVVQSGNDAAVAVAEGLAGNEDSFANSLNDRARALGMTRSHFANASGWPDPDHYSTVRDLAILASRTIADFPQYYHYFAEPEFTYPPVPRGNTRSITQPNRNPLLFSTEGADGLKTGHTEDGGYGLMGSAKRGDRRLVLVLNGLASMRERAQEGKRLLDWGFRAFDTVTLFRANDEIDKAQVWLAQPATVPVRLAEDVKITIPARSLDRIRTTLTMKVPLSLPVEYGQEIGTLTVSVPDWKDYEYKVVAGQRALPLGFLGRIMAVARHLTMAQP